MRATLSLIGLLFAAATAPATAAEFTVQHKSGEQPGPTLLIVGGIQGDEPGGFMAASLLTTHYTIKKGQVWVVPNLNFESIIARHRGVHGDMNRKFSRLPDDDPEFTAVQRVKQLITDPRVDAVVNLHDGSGFYREKHIDPRHSPWRWGQCTIIDQPNLEGVPFGNLTAIAQQVTDHVNQHLIDPDHSFLVRDTRTRWGNEEMAKTLTFFAIENNKPAFAVEASKDFGTTYRTYYHLLAVEGYMKAFGIEFERRFPLTPFGVEAAIDAHPQIALYDRRVVLDVADARSELSYVPLKKDGELKFSSSSPLVALVGQGSRGGYQVCYGNRRLTRLHPEFLEFDDALTELALEVDGQPLTVPFGSIIPVGESFVAKAPEGYRVNLIGYTRDGLDDEAGIPVAHGDFMERFSVDRKGRIFRVEVYRDKKFAGMVLVDFSTRTAQPEQWFTGTTIARSPRAPANITDENLGR